MPSLLAQCTVISLLLLFINTHGLNIIAAYASFIERMSVLKSLKSLGSKAKRKIGANDHHPGPVSSEPFWMERVNHQGRAPFHPDPQYKVFRNVKVHPIFDSGDAISNIRLINRIMVLSGMESRMTLVP